MCVIIKMELDSQSSVSTGTGGGGASFNWNLNHIRIDASSEAQVLSSLQSAGLTYVEAKSAIRLFRDLPVATDDNQKQRILVNSRNLILYLASSFDDFSIAETGEKLHDLGQQWTNYADGEACGINGVLGRHQNCRHNDQAELLEQLFAEHEDLAGLGSCDRKLVDSIIISSALTNRRFAEKPLRCCEAVVREWAECGLRSSWWKDRFSVAAHQPIRNRVGRRFGEHTSIGRVHATRDYHRVAYAPQLAVGEGWYRVPEHNRTTFNAISTCACELTVKNLGEREHWAGLGRSNYSRRRAAALQEILGRG